jgi:hypothetical protein
VYVEAIIAMVELTGEERKIQINARNKRKRLSEFSQVDIFSSTLQDEFQIDRDSNKLV